MPCGRGVRLGNFEVTRPNDLAGNDGEHPRLALAPLPSREFGIPAGNWSLLTTETDSESEHRISYHASEYRQRGRDVTREAAACARGETEMRKRGIRDLSLYIYYAKYLSRICVRGHFLAFLARNRVRCSGSTRGSVIINIPNALKIATFLTRNSRAPD